MNKNRKSQNSDSTARLNNIVPKDKSSAPRNAILPVSTNSSSNQPSITAFFQKTNSVIPNSHIPNNQSSVKKTHNYSKIVEDLLAKAKTIFAIGDETEESDFQPQRSNKSYSLEQKKAAVELSKYLTQAEIQRKLKIPESTLRDWIKHGVKEDKRKNASGRKPMLPEIEDETYKFFKEQRRLDNNLFFFHF